LDWKGGGLVRDNHPGCPFRNAQAKLERVRVKINWRQAAHHFAPIQLQTLESPIDKINGAAVIQRHALGNARRAGSMNQAIRIGVDDCFQPFEQHGLVIKRLGGHRLLDQQQAIGWDVQRAQGIGILRGRNNDVRVEVLQHAFETLRRRFDIQVGVGVATVKDAEIGNDVLGALGQEDRYGPPHHGTVPQYQGRAVFGKMPDLAEGKLMLLVNHRYLAPAYGQGALFKILDNINLHDSSVLVKS